METGDVVYVDLLPPLEPIELTLELVDFFPYEPAMYVHADQWEAFEAPVPDETSIEETGIYSIMTDGTVYHTLGAGRPNMEVGVCQKIRDHYNDDRW